MEKPVSHFDHAGHILALAVYPSRDMLRVMKAALSPMVLRYTYALTKPGTHYAYMCHAVDDVHLSFGKYGIRTSDELMVGVYAYIGEAIGGRGTLSMYLRDSGYSYTPKDCVTWWMDHVAAMELYLETHEDYAQAVGGRTDQ